LATNRSFSPLQLSAVRLILVAGAFHIILVLGISLIGITGILPSTFNADGVGISFAIDSIGYHQEASEMAQLLQKGRFQDWLDYPSVFPTTLHIRIYSLGFTALGKLVGFRTLAAEPLNLIYYVSILLLTYAVGSDVFGPKVGRLAALSVSVWPSFLLHTTQLLRDPLFISAMLLLIWGMLFCIRRELSVLKALAITAIALFAVLVALLCRPDVREILLVALLLAGGICIVTQLRERRVHLQNILAIVVVTIFAIWVPMVLPTGRLSGHASSESSSPAPTQAGQVQRSTDVPSWEKFARRVGLLRHKFIVAYPLAGSNVDTGVELNSVTDLIRYLPRAAEVGYFAPFPYMWFVRGEQVGIVGRLVSGAEMLVMYFVFGLSVVTLVQQRNRLIIWFLFLLSAVGCIALGYVVVNISALYRMRYTFFILLLILGVQGLLGLAKQGNKSQRTSEIEAVTTG
jgi:hypothetical protein